MEIYKVIIDDEGDTRWYNELGQLHCLHSPAHIYKGNKFWHKNNKRHRLDGPAIEYSDGTKEWWIDDTQYTEEEFNKIVNKKEMTIGEIEKLLGYSIKKVF